MKQTVLAWRFRSPAPLPLTQALKRLGRTWEKNDSDYRLDSISGTITGRAWACIFQEGLTNFIVHLNVKAECDSDLEAETKQAREKLFRDILPRLEAREIKESPAGAANDYMSGTGYYLS
jgi:hypothetical protein